MLRKQSAVKTHPEIKPAGRKIRKIIHIICPVRGVTEEQKREMDGYVAKLRAEGHHVHYPPDSVNQEDETGYNICLGHYRSMFKADEVHMFWDLSSKGSHFDLGMFFALWRDSLLKSQNRPNLVLAKLFQEDAAGKSYVKVMREIIKLQDGS